MSAYVKVDVIFRKMKEPTTGFNIGSVVGKFNFMSSIFLDLSRYRVLTERTVLINTFAEANVIIISGETYLGLIKLE